MTLYTVTEVQFIDGRVDDVLPFVFVYRTREDAVQAIEDNAKDDWNAMQDPNEDPEDAVPYEGLTWDDAMTKADDGMDDDRCEYTITAVEIAK